MHQQQADMLLRRYSMYITDIWQEISIQKLHRMSVEVGDLIYNKHCYRQVNMV
ncbi:hypothetical protein DWX71_10185 [Ruminococcus bromii]|nr:hypothetical protein DWX71_10185 [Ruminococcus bromii]